MLLKEYIVTLKNKSDLESFYSDMEQKNQKLFIPNRAVECVEKRSISRNTHYLLNIDEAEELKKDPRVAAVSLNSTELGLQVESHATQLANFNRSSSIAFGHKNYGLYRSYITKNDPTWTGDKVASITLNRTGQDVDVVIVDEILYPNHIEYSSRSNQIDWFAEYDTLVRTTGTQIARIERASDNVSRITTKSPHGLKAGNYVTVVCPSDSSFNVTNVPIIDVSATPVGLGGDGVTINRFRYSNPGSVVNVITRTVISVARSNDVTTVICSSSHSLSNGQTIGINITTTGYSTFAAANVPITIVNSTTFTYPNIGSDVSTTSVSGNVYPDGNLGTWTGNYLYNNYSGNNNHATVIAGIIGGSTQGWARDANLYNIRHDYSNNNTFVPLEYVIDYVRYWHLDKPIDPVTGRRTPTLVNCSWGVSRSTTARNNYTGGNNTNISRIFYRGSTIEATDLGNSPLDVGFSGVCNSNTVIGELKGAQVGSTPATTVIFSSSGSTGTGQFAKASLIGTINAGDYVECNATGWLKGARITSVIDAGTEYIFTVNFFKNTTVTSTSTATCTFYSSTMENIGFEIITTNSTTATVTSIPAALGGSSSMIDTGAPTGFSVNGLNTYDDATWSIVLPFNIVFAGNNYGPSYGSGTVGDDAYLNVSSNSFVVFGGGPVLGFNKEPQPTGPSARKIVISGSDLSARKVYTQTTGSTPNRIFRIRWEGHNAPEGGDVNNPTMIWEMKFFEATNNRIELHVGSNANYRGEFTSSQLLDYGINLNSSTVPQRYAALDADIEDCIDDGIIFVGSSGNNNYKIDAVGGLDYNNYYVEKGVSYYYHRGSSPGSQSNVICVGALSSSSSIERKTFTSNAGPRVDLYAPAENIISSVYDGSGAGTSSTIRNTTYEVSISAVSRNNATSTATITTATAHALNTGDLITIQTVSDFSFQTTMTPIVVTGPNSFTYTNVGPNVAVSTPATGTVWPGYFYQKYEGSSIAAAQVSGVLALALEEYPDMDQTEARNYITRYARAGLMSNTAGGYSDDLSLQDGPNKILYYYKEREISGFVSPKVNYRVRPESGLVFPRPRIKRT